MPQIFVVLGQILYLVDDLFLFFKKKKRYFKCFVLWTQVNKSLKKTF